jgi:hypothetical protein
VVLDDKVEHFATSGALLFDVADPPYKVVVGGNRANPLFNFRGAISCVQFFPNYMSESAIHSRKDCEATASVHKSKSPCPADFTYYDGACYQVCDLAVTDSYFHIHYAQKSKYFFIYRDSHA